METSPIKSFRNSWIVRISALGFLGGIFLSWNLWGIHPNFPHLPLFDWVPEEISEILRWGLISSLCILIVQPKKWAAQLALTTYLLFLFLDQIRLQPWCYLYSLILLLFVLDKPNANKLGRWVVAIMYIYAGWHKFNDLFSVTTFQPMLKFFSVEAYTLFKHHFSWAWVIAPITELAIGVMLLWGKKLKLALLLGTTMHFILIIYLLGIGFNSVVIPWNLTMIILLWFLAQQANKEEEPSPLKFRSKLLIASVAILPLFSKYDHYLSFELYSGSVSAYFAKIDEDSKQQFPADAITKQSPELGPHLDLSLWCLSALNVGYPAEERHAKTVKQWLVNQGVKNPEIKRCEIYYLSDSDNCEVVY